MLRLLCRLEFLIARNILQVSATAPLIGFSKAGEANTTLKQIHIPAKRDEVLLVGLRRLLAFGIKGADHWQFVSLYKGVIDWLPHNLSEH